MKKTRQQNGIIFSDRSYNNDLFSFDTGISKNNQSNGYQIYMEDSKQTTVYQNSKPEIIKTQLNFKIGDNHSNQSMNYNSDESIVNCSRLIDTFPDSEIKASENPLHNHYLNLYKIAKPFLLLYQSDSSLLPFQMHMPYSDCSSLHDKMNFEKDLNPHEGKIETQILKFSGEFNN